jgi:hypothetical protein
MGAEQIHRRAAKALDRERGVRQPRGAGQCLARKAQATDVELLTQSTVGHRRAHAQQSGAAELAHQAAHARVHFVKAGFCALEQWRQRLHGPLRAVARVSAVAIVEEWPRQIPRLSRRAHQLPSNTGLALAAKA